MDMIRCSLRWKHSRPRLNWLGVGFFCLALFQITTLVQAGSLTCAVASTCEFPSVAVIRMYKTTNTHAELPSQANYPQIVCCSGVTGLSNTCTGTFDTVLKLSGITNAHVEQNTQNTYSTSTCLSVPGGGVIEIAYQSNNCTGYDTTLLSMSGVSNAHIGDDNAFITKICGTASAGGVSITLSSDGVVFYGTLPAGASTSTITAQLNDTQVAKNDGTSAEDFNIRGQNSANWTLGAVPGNDQYVHQFCASNCGNPPTNFIALTTNYQTLATNITPNGSQGLDLRITTPTPSSVFTQQFVDVTIQAVAH